MHHHTTIDNILRKLYDINECKSCENSKRSYLRKFLSKNGIMLSSCLQCIIVFHFTFSCRRDLIGKRRASCSELYFQWQNNKILENNIKKNNYIAKCFVTKINIFINRLCVRLYTCHCYYKINIKKKMFEENCLFM